MVRTLSIAIFFFALGFLPSCHKTMRPQQGDYHPKAMEGSTLTTRVAASTVYNNGRHNIVTIWHPAPSPAFKGTYIDVHHKGRFRPFPERFIIGDGILTRAFVLVDYRPNSALADAIERIARATNSNKVLDDVTFRLAELVGNRWRQGVNRLGDNSWDPKNYRIAQDSQKRFVEAGKLPVGHQPKETNQLFPVVPLERFLACRTCSAYCLQKVILAKLILDRFGVKSRMVTGAIVHQAEEFGPFTTEGHSWLEVASDDNEYGYVILDPTWGQRGAPERIHPTDTNWVMFSGQYRVPNQGWPVLKLINR
jgi:hypothetical protein